MPIDADLAARLENIRTVDLVTTGRRSGRPRQIEIWWFRFEDRFVITGTPGRRDWLANVIANPRVEISTRLGAFSASTSLIDDRAFRRRFFTHRAATWYGTQVELERLVAEAPMIEVVLD